MGRDQPQGAWKLTPAGPELVRLPAHTGTWPNEHQEPGFYVKGTWDSELRAEGYFLCWFETTNLVYPNCQKGQASRIGNGREVDIWGYSDTAKLYFRLDVTTYLNGNVPAPVVDSQTWWSSYGKGVVSISPFTTKVGDRVVPVRVGLLARHPTR